MGITETWKPIPGYEGSYEASDHGRVRGIDRITDRGRKWRGQIMTPATMPAGYQYITLWQHGKQKSALVHRLVLFAFRGQPPPGNEALHRDGNPANNTLSNLRWGTPSENHLDQVAHGTQYNATKTFCPKGHPYDAANTYTYPGAAHRACRQCRRNNLRNWKEANPERARELARRASQRYQAKKASEAKS